MLGKQLDLLSAPDEPKTLSPVRRRLLDAAGDIMASEPEELAFQHSLLCQTYLGSPADCVMPVPRQAAWSTRLRSRLKPARPYMARLIVFSRLI
jgi:hypothetical protein